jgi:soluble lytic murein transglycosylase
LKSLFFRTLTLSGRGFSCKRGINYGFGLAFLALVLLAPVRAGFAEDAAMAKVTQALKAMDRDQWSVARKLVSESHDPVASKLYMWKFFQQTKDNEPVNFSLLAPLIKNNPGWPGMRRLREKAERNMPKDLSAGEVVSWFSLYPPQSAPGLDRYLEALVISGKKSEAKEILTTWWASSLATRDEQRSIYMRYGGMLDMSAHRKRLDTLLFSGQYTNARAIAQVLGKGYTELTEARIALAEQKPGVAGYVAKVPANLQGDPGLLYERLRWRRERNLDMDAMKILHDHPPVDQIHNPEDWWKEQHILIRRLLEKKMYESASLLASKHFQTSGVAYAEAEWMAGWLNLRFMKNPPKAYERFEALYGKVETPISKARAAYWTARAAEGMKQSILGKEWYQKAAKFQTTFYGQLAGAKLGLSQALPNAAPPGLSAEDIAGFENSDFIRAARYLHGAKMQDDASDFLEAFVDHEKTPKAYRFAAELAAKMGYYRDAVKISKDATKEGMFLTAQSYPVVTDKLQNVDTEWALAHAIIRQESMFDPGAVSPTGALGLMQLMPGTAKQVAKKEGVSYSAQALTMNPALNIRLGCRYMDDLLARYDGSYPLAIAAYNAGPSNVNKWIETFGDPRTGEIDPIDWMELISFPETRNYVQRVLESVYVYRLRLKGIQQTPTHSIHVAMVRAIN